MRKILIMKCMLMLFLLSEVCAQSRVITGKVTDAATNQGLPGVTVLVKGTSTGASTDIDGNYSLPVPATGTVSFSFIGYTTVERAIGNATTLNVALNVDAAQLGEVVITGYGTQTKPEVTGSVRTVNSSQLENRPVASVDQILQGQVAGLQSVAGSGQPGANQQVRIRGIGSINAGSNPLYVVDGIIINSGQVSRLSTTSNQLAGLNPNDIESVTVLKDAAATSIYGSRGSNGVIIITTKRGVAGKTKFNFTTEQGYTDIAKRPEAGEFLNAQEWLALTREGMVNAGRTPDRINTDMTALGEGSGVDTDWYDLVTRRGNQQTYNFSASGGSEKTTFFASAGLFEQEAPVMGSKLRRISGSLNLNNKVSDKISFFTNLNISNVNQDAPLQGGAFGNPLGAAGFLLPTQNPYNTDGTFNINRAGTLGYSGNYNPLYVMANDQRHLRNTKVLGSVGAEWTIIKNLKYTSRIGADYINLEEVQFNNPFHGDGRASSGRGFNYYTRVFNWITTNQLDYRFTVPGVEKLSIDATAAYEAQQSREYNINAGASGYPPTTSLPSSIVAASPTAGSATGSDYTFASIISRLTVNFADKYILSGTYRRDGSSRFGSENRFGNFWSVGASYNLDQEEFMQSLGMISTLKLRSSYGVNGNGDIGNYAWRPLFSYGINYNQQPGGAFNSIGNINLTWELNKPFNVGVDFGILEDRFTLTADYYVRTTSNLLLNRQISRTTGFNSIFQNVGEMQNKGFELTLAGYPINGEFKWNTNFNIAFNKNKITKLPGGADIIDGAYILREGEDYRTFYAREWAGVDSQTGNPQWYTEGEGTDVTSTYNAAQRILYKSASPKYFGGFNNTFSYKGFNLDGLFVFNAGNYVREGWEFYLMDGNYALANKYRKNLNRWQKEGDITDVPRYVYNLQNNSNSFSTRFLYKGDFIRLRNITFGYDLKQAWIQKLRLSRVNVYVRGTNLLTRVFDENLPMDPEAGINSTSDAAIPNAKSFTLGLNVNF